MKNQTLTLLFIISFITNGFSQQWQHYTARSTNKSLGGNNITNSFKDNSGNLWISHNLGVSKFENNIWKNYTAYDSIPGYGISIAQDGDGVIWAGSDNGLAKLINGEWIKIPLLDSLGMPGVYITCLTFDDQGILWCGTWDNGLLKYDGTSFNYFPSTTPLLHNKIMDLKIDNLGQKWLATDYGVSIFNNTSCVQIDSLIDYTGINAIEFDQNGNTWIGTHGQGLIKYDGLNAIPFTVTDGLLSNIVYDLTIDNQGDLWIVTAEGLSRFNGVTWLNYTINEGLSSNFIKTIVLDNQDNKWVGAFYNGISKYDNTNWTYYHPKTDGLYSPSIIDYYPTTSISIDSLGIKWFTNNGISLFNDSIWNYFDSSSVNELYNCGELLIDKENNKWVYTQNNNGSILKLENSIWTVIADNIFPSSSGITSMEFDNVGNIWLGSSNDGIKILNINSLNWFSFTTLNGLVHNQINCIEKDLDGSMWIGTNNGISMFNGINWTSYTPSNGLWWNLIGAIGFDKFGNKWFSSNQGGGIAKFDNINWTVYNQNFNANLFSNLNQFSYLSNTRKIIGDNDGNVWFGNVKFNGVNFQKIEDTTYNIIYPVGIYDLKIEKNGDVWFSTGYGCSKLTNGCSGPISNNCIGIVFNDENGDGIKNITETNISQQIIQIDSNYTLNHENGMFYYNLSNGQHTISYNAPIHWQSTTNDTVLINIPNSGDTIYFGIKAIDNIHDLRINMVGSATRANFEAIHWINYANIGTLNETGSVVMNLDDRVSYVSAIPTPTSINGDILTWNFTNLLVNEQKQIRVTTQMPDVQYLGDTLITSVSILPIIGDTNQLNNVDTLFQVLTGSYDPNDKTVHQGVLDENYVLFDQTLDYTIRFQNTGTDTAFNVNVYDTISSFMDMSTLQLLGTSHPCQMELRGTNVVVFHFYDILLPDSNVNQLGSNGFIQYSISPKDSLDENTVVNNTGYIYFDYNPAIITNTAFNTYVSVIPSAVGIIEKIQKGGISIYPNPTQGNLTIDLGKIQNTTQVKITDFQGREIKHLSCKNTQFIDVDLSDSAEGVYFITVKSEEKEFTFKMIKQ